MSYSIVRSLMYETSASVSRRPGGGAMTMTSRQVPVVAAAVDVTGTVAGTLYVDHLCTDNNGMASNNKRYTFDKQLQLSSRNNNDNNNNQ